MPRKNTSAPPPGTQAGVVTAVKTAAVYYPTPKHNTASIRIIAVLQNGTEVLVGHPKIWNTIYIASMHEARLRELASALIGQNVEYKTRKIPTNGAEEKICRLMKTCFRPEALQAEFRSQ